MSEEFGSGANPPVVVIRWDRDRQTDWLELRRDGEPSMVGAMGIADAMMAALSRGAELHIPVSVYEQLLHERAIPREMPDWIKIR
jgi:hypothetical protein